MNKSSALILQRGLRWVVPFLFFAGSVSAQQPDFNFRQLGSEDGLNNPSIFNIDQHPNGVLYVTTQNGVYAYDGYTFSRLAIDSLQSNALETAVIRNPEELFLSVRGRGIATFDLHSHAFRMAPWGTVADHNADQVIVTGRFAYLLTSQVKLVVVDVVTGKPIPDTLRKGAERNLPLCMYRTREGRVLVGRTDGLYDLSDGVHHRLPVLRDLPVYSLAEDRSGRLLAGSSGVIYTIGGNQVTGEIRPAFASGESTFLPGGQKSITHLLADDFGRIWFTAFPGQNVYLFENGRVYDLFESLGIQPSLINCLFRDQHQNVWIGTMGDGLYQVQNTFFRSYDFRFNDKVLNINGVYLQDNMLVAATSNGLYGLNLRSAQARVLSQPDQVFLEPVYALAEDRGVLYYCKRNELSMKPTIFMDARNTYRFRPVSAREILPLRGDSAIVATWDGYIVLAAGGGTLPLDTLISFSDYRIAVHALHLHEGTLYAGTSNGLYTYDFATHHPAQLVKPGLNYSINDLSVVSGKLIASHEGGITEVSSGRLIGNVGAFVLNSVRKVRAYQDQVWIATLDGVFICDTALRPLRVLNRASGLLSNSVSDFTFDGSRVAIATTRGVSLADFRDILRYNTRLKPVTIDHLRVDDRVIRSTDQTFQLNADAGEATLFFYSPLFTRPNKQYFRYRENGGTWNHFTDLSHIPLAALSGGRHTFELQASADQIQWSEPVTVVIEKEERFTEKQAMYWLTGLAVLAAASVVSWFIIRRVNRTAVRRLTQEQQVNLLKHQAMNALLSPHFIFNSLTSIQNYINTNNSLRASEYLAKFSRLIRMIIEKAGQSHITLHDELARLTYYLELEKERFKNKFDYEIVLDPAIKTQEVMIPNMIIQPYVENSILHGILPKNAPGKLLIAFRLNGEGRLHITIDDDGIGLVKAAEHAKTGHKSLGTSTIRSILEINSKLTGKAQRVTMTDKSVDNPAATGTVIKIELEL